MNRRTLSDEVLITGKSWYGGLDTWVKCSPSEGGIFLSVGENRVPIEEARVNQQESSYTTSIFIGTEKIFMVEHLFSAINGLEIDDVEIQFGSNEVPFSADSKLFTDMLEKFVVDIEDDSRECLKINQIITISDGEKWCKIYPAEKLEVEVSVQFDSPINKQSFSYVQSPDNYLFEISEARSALIFPIDDVDPWKNYRKQFPIFPKTLSADPTTCPLIAYTHERFLNGQRFDNEVARHKILDFLGDILLVGKPIRGRFVLNRPGHRFNAKIVEKILEVKQLPAFS